MSTTTVLTPQQLALQLAGNPAFIATLAAAILGSPGLIIEALNAQIAAGAIPASSTVTGTNAGLCTDGDFLCTGRTTS